MNFAIEDIERGLKRLIVAAKDLRKMDDSKSVEGYYSEAIAGILEKSELKFDPKHLK